MILIGGAFGEFEAVARGLKIAPEHFDFAVQGGHHGARARRQLRVVGVGPSRRTRRAEDRLSIRSIVIASELESEPPDQFGRRIPNKWFKSVSNRLTDRSHLEGPLSSWARLPIMRRFSGPRPFEEA